MKRNKKSAILIILIVAVTYIWIPKGKKPAAASADEIDEPVVSVVVAMPKKRTEFTDWNRNPFVWPQEAKDKTDVIPGLTVFAITLDGENSEAMIGESVVRVGDKIADKTVKRIEQDRVILTDGAKDYVLKL